MNTAEETQGELPLVAANKISKNGNLEDLFSNAKVKEKFEKVLGQNMDSFIASLLQIVKGNSALKKADKNTILTAAMTAAVLKLPINDNLGFAWIVPYGNKAQFQMGWRGFVQLALRTGQYNKINVTEIFENQFFSFNNLTEELNCDFSKEGAGEIVGYAAYFKLINGMEKTTYWKKSEVVKHAKRYSKAYNFGGQSPWHDAEQFHAMAKKTVLKNMLSKWGIMSIEMQMAQMADQAIQEKEGSYIYVDNVISKEELAESEEMKRVLKFIDNAQNEKDLEEIKSSLSEELKIKCEKHLEKKESELIKK